MKIFVITAVYNSEATVSEANRRRRGRARLVRDLCAHLVEGLVTGPAFLSDTVSSPPAKSWPTFMSRLVRFLPRWLFPNMIRIHAGPTSGDGPDRPILHPQTEALLDRLRKTRSVG